MNTVPTLSPTRLDQLRVRQLRFLNQLASLGSLAATADRLSITPSAASMMLKEIEGIFNVRLFRRQGRGMVPTAEGLALLPRCKSVLGEVGAMASTAATGTHGLLRVGAFPHTTTTVLPNIVRQFLAPPTPWHVKIVDASAKQLVYMLLQNEIDLLLGRLPRSLAHTSGIEDIAQHVLYDGKLSIVASQDHPLSKRKNLRLGELTAWNWILPSTESTTRMALVDEFLRQGLIPPNPLVESPSFFYSLSIVANTHLLTCCAQTAALHSGHATTILPIPLQAEAGPVCMLWRKDSHLAGFAVERLQNMGQVE